MFIVNIEEELRGKVPTKQVRPWVPGFLGSTSATGERKDGGESGWAVFMVAKNKEKCSSTDE